MFITGVIGYPLKLTYSPLLHNTAFKRLPLSGVYYPLCVPPAEFKNIIFKLKELGFNGVNITNPYKIEILEYLDEISHTGEDIGAVNTVIIKDNKLIGENTDVNGFNQSLKEHNINIKGKEVLMIGAGGVARAIAYVLKSHRPKKITITNRTISKARLVSKICGAEVIKLEDIHRFIRDVDLVINATSIDMCKKIIPLLKGGSIYYDTNYRFKSPVKDGIRLIDGISMLIFQAAYSFSLWTDKKPPFKIMKGVIKGGVV